MRTSLSLALTLILASAASLAVAGQTVWKWVDDKGVTHFSDQPVPGATKMELNSSPSRSESTPAPSYSAPSQTSSQPAQKGPAYVRFVVERPQPDEAVINTGGRVAVQLGSSPAIQNGMSIALYLDGALVQDYSSPAMSHELTNVPRGTHTLKAVVSTAQGEPVQETPPITFHVRQESAAQPPVGPSIRNQSKPRPNGASNKMRTSQPTYSALNGAPALIDPRTNLPPVAKPLPAGPKAGN
jgi:hypothetical protein